MMNSSMPASRRSPKVTPSGWLPILLLSLAALSALAVLGSRFWLLGGLRIPNTPLITLLMLASGVTANRDVSFRYQWSIVAGLGFSSAGDSFLMLTGDYFVPGLASFLIAHICYLWAFTADNRLLAYKLPFIVWGTWGVGLLLWLWPGVAGPLRFPVVLYTLTLVSMAAQAAGCAISRRNAAAILAAAGAALFVVSDSVLAMQRFHPPFEGGRSVVLATYFAAQGGIALSVVLRRY